MKPPFDTDERSRLYNAGLLNRFLPLVFSDGTSWNEIKGYCANCDKDVTLYGECNAPFADIYHLKAVGYCPTCELTTCFEWNLKPDSVTGYDRDNIWQTWNVEPKSFWKRLWRKLIA